MLNILPIFSDTDTTSLNPVALHDSFGTKYISDEIPVLQNRHGNKVLDTRFSRTDKSTSSPPEALSTNLHNLRLPTKISSVDSNGQLQIRKKNINELVEGFSFPQVAYLTLTGETVANTNEELCEFNSKIIAAMNLGQNTEKFLDECLKKGQKPIQILATAINFLSPSMQDDDPVLAIKEQSPKLIGQVLGITAYLYRKSHGLESIRPSAEKGLMDNLVHMMFTDTLLIDGDEAKNKMIEIMNKLLILRVDHGLAPSSFTARTVASTEAGPSAGLAAAINSISGKLHGDKTANVLERIGKLEDESKINDLWASLSDSDKTKMGLGHSIYKSSDPRTEIYRGLCQKLFTDTSFNVPATLKKKFELAEKFAARASEEGYMANAHFYSAFIYEALGFDQDHKILMFPAGRTAGIMAHMIEQLSYQGHVKDRPIRPREFSLN